jgi:hypothetical protein
MKIKNMEVHYRPDLGGALVRSGQNEHEIKSDADFTSIRSDAAGFNLHSYSGSKK